MKIINYKISIKVICYKCLEDRGNFEYDVERN